MTAGGRASQATGDVLEVAVGTGLNLGLYPEDARLTGIEWSPAMLEIARRRADHLGRAVDLREGDAQALPFPDASFDTVVCTLSLCAIPDDQRAMAEMIRVLRRPAPPARPRRCRQPAGTRHPAAARTGGGGNGERQVLEMPGRRQDDGEHPGRGEQLRPPPPNPAIGPAAVRSPMPKSRGRPHQRAATHEPTLSSTPGQEGDDE